MEYISEMKMLLLNNMIFSEGLMFSMDHRIEFTNLNSSFNFIFRKYDEYGGYMDYTIKIYFDEYLEYLRDKKIKSIIDVNK